MASHKPEEDMGVGKNCGVVVALVVGLAFVGCKNKDNAAGGASATPVSGAVNVKADEKGFTPSSVSFKKGLPASLVFTRTTDETCATEVVFPALKIKKELPKNTPVTIDVPTDKDQTLSFECGMGMYKSSVVIAPN